MTSVSRRNFLHTGSLAFVGAASMPRLMGGNTGKKLFSAVGIAAPIDKAAVMKAAGAEFITENVGNFLVPDKPEAEFDRNLAKLASSPLPILACNGVIRPAHLHCVGAEANHDSILAWSEITFRRMQKAGGKIIVFGSSSAREIPDGWSKEKADAQFVALLKRMGPLAQAHGIIVTVEQLQTEECNYINHLAEGAALIRATGHPHIRLLADLYHMACMGDTPDALKAAMDVVAHVEIAEKKARTVPGVSGDDFRPFFQILREANYQGALSIEGKWSDAQLAPAFTEIGKQAGEV